MSKEGTTLCGEKKEKMCLGERQENKKGRFFKVKYPTKNLPLFRFWPFKALGK